MKTVSVKLGNRSYEIHIGAGMVASTGKLLRESGCSGKAVIITDSTVKAFHEKTLRDSLVEAGLEVVTLEIPAGEEQKSLETAGLLYSRLSDCRAERGTPVLALGGGVIGDLTGFIAATFLRGVPFIQVPTTLLAQVDSSIGGKVGLDYGSLKNKIGTFYQPKFVIADISVLKTLPASQVRNGLAEVIKYAVIRDGGFLAYIEKNLGEVLSFDEAVLEEIVYRSAKTKADVVEKDEKDTGLRNILNYGHTIGHAVESVSEFRLAHGEAVAVGMVAAARISNRIGFLSKTEMEHLISVIKKAGLPVKMPDFDTNALVAAMQHDKKIVNGKTRFVLPVSIGEVVVTDEVSPSLVREMLESLK